MGHSERLLWRTLSPRGLSPPGDPLLQRTFSRLAAIHLVLLRNSPCTPGHPLLLRNSPCEYIPVRSTAASLGNCSCVALPSPVPGLVRPTVPQAYVDQLLYSLVCPVGRVGNGVSDFCDLLHGHILVQHLFVSPLGNLLFHFSRLSASSYFLPDMHDVDPAAVVGR